MYSHHDPGLPRGDPELTGSHHDFGLRVDQNKMKIEWMINSIKLKTNIASKRILYPY